MADKTLSIIIPLYNEEATITELLDRVLAVDLPIGREIIIVNDGSTDDSRGCVDAWQARLPADPGVMVRVIDKPNGGKGSAVRAGIEVSSGDVVIIQDADLEYDPHDYRKCIEPILAGRASVVYGSRERLSENRMHSSLAFYAGGLAVTCWMNLLYGASMTDEPTCYKTFDGLLIRTLPFTGDRFEWEPEITAKLLRLGYGIDEVPVSYTPRKIDEGKKINWRDGVMALWTALSWRLRPMGAVRRTMATVPAAAARMKTGSCANRLLLAVMAVALLLRLALALPAFDSTQRFMRPDSKTYLDPAQALLADRALMEAPGSSVPATLRTPGYSVFLAFVLGITGNASTAVADYRLPVLLFCVLSTLVCVPIFRAGQMFGGTGVGTVAAALYAANLTSIAHAPMFLSDTLFTFVAAWMFYCFTRFYFKERLIDLWLAISLNGVATLIKPIGLMWIVPCCFLVLIFVRKSWAKRWLGAVVCVVVFLAVITPWMFRNQQVGAGFRLGSNIGKTLYYHNCAALVSVLTGESAEVLRQRWQAETAAVFVNDPAYASIDAQTGYLLGKAQPIIRDNLWQYARLHCQPPILFPDAPTFLELLGLTETGQGTLDVFHRQGLVAAVQHYFGDRLWLLLPLAPLLAIVGFTYLGCFLQLGCWLLQRQWFLGFFFLAFVVYYLVLPGPVLMPRYQLPCLPLMTVMAGMFWLGLWRHWRQSRETVVAACPA